MAGDGESKLLGRQAIKIVCLCIAWYSFSSANNVLGKQIFNVFPYPMTVCMVQLLAINAFLGPALAILNIQPAPYMTRKFYVRRMTPLALGKLFATLSAHVSILKVPVSYAHTVKAMMPFFTVLLSVVIMREHYPLKVYLSLVPIVSGVFIATVTELSFDLVGLVAALSATILFALQNIYSKKCMRDTHIHHLRLLLVLSQLCCVFLFPVWMYTDVWDIITTLHKVKHLGWLLFALPVDGVLTFGQNIVAFSMISAVSPVSYSVANATKRIVIISVSLMLLRNPVTPWNVCGMVTAISGVALYNKAKLDSMKKGQAPILPMSAKPSADPLHISDMHAGSEAYQIDMDASYRNTSSPMKII